MNQRLVLLMAALCAAVAMAEEKKVEKKAEAPKPVAKPEPKYVIPPTMMDVHYGPATNQVLDFYKANSDKPTPLVFFIHGGGWTAGSKKGIDPRPYLSEGISVVSVEYRFVSEATAAGAKPPVDWPLKDAARALQFVRSKAAEWNIDKARVGASGGSAGACSSLWLAFHDDLADAKSSDPVARESTRLKCAAVTGAQTSLDPKQMKEWTPNSRYGGHAFNVPADPARRIAGFESFLAAREAILPWIAEYSPYALVTKDDPPVYLTYGKAPAMGKDEPDPTHTANFGVGLQAHMKDIGVPCELFYPAAPDAPHKTMQAYLIETLKAGG